jgi:hypothetical protein
METTEMNLPRRAAASRMKGRKHDEDVEELGITDVNKILSE